jgi:hypothetical protein
MAGKPNTTGGNTQNIDEKPKKPKTVCEVRLTIRDDGSLIGDFWVTEDDEYGRRKKWTVGGDDFFKFLFRTQPKNVRAIASCLNLQIVQAGLPEDQQGPWITMKGGKPRLLGGDEIKDAMAKAPNAGAGNKLATSSETHAEKQVGGSLPPPTPTGDKGPQAV